MPANADNELDVSLSSCGSFMDSLQPPRPQGRTVPFEDLTLLHVPDEPLYIPATQDPAPLTEDMLDEQLEIMAK